MSVLKFVTSQIQFWLHVKHYSFILVFGMMVVYQVYTARLQRLYRNVADAIQ